MEFGSVRPGHLPRRAMELPRAVYVECRDEVSAADVERFGASLSSEQRALVTTFNANSMKFTAWPELVRLFPNLDHVYTRHCGLVEFPLAVCSLPNLRLLNLPYNNFVEIPSEVSRLQQLGQLYIFACKRLQRLPSSISTLTALSVLNLDGCDKLPDEFSAAFYHCSGVQDVLGRISKNFARFEHCRAACVTLIGLRRSRLDTILLSHPLDITVLVAKLLWWTLSVIVGPNNFHLLCLEEGSLSLRISRLLCLGSHSVDAHSSYCRGNRVGSLVSL